MSFKTMAESIILQAMEDLDNPEYRAESLDFFHGYRFRMLARMAEINEKEIKSFRDYTKRYMLHFCSHESPALTDIRVIKRMAKASTKHRQPLFIHLIGTS